MRKASKFISMLLVTTAIMNISFAAVAADDRIGEIVAKMTTEQKISQMIMPSLRYYADENGDKEPLTALNGVMGDLIRKYQFAGVILFAMNTTGTEQTLRLTDEIQKANKSSDFGQLFIAVDQEGGRVTRLASGTQFAGNMALGATGSTGYAYETGSVIGEELQALGINTDFAPVVDVNNNPSNPVIGVRSFSDDADTVARFGKAFMNGLKSTDTISTLKHFPGHGNTDTDSHTGLPCINSTYDELKKCELIPFKECIESGAEMIMTAHIQYPNIEKNTYKSIYDGKKIFLPATLSKTIITDILRSDMGYDGIVVTDAMEMDAIKKHFNKIDAMKLAINAGVDILLCPGDIITEDDAAEFEKLIKQLSIAADNGDISIDNVNSSVKRILKLKESKGLLRSYDGSELENRIANAKTVVGSKRHHDKEWEITKKAITLVKNEGEFLPINRENEKTVIITAYPDEITSMQYAKELLTSEGKLPKGSEIEIVSFRKSQSGNTVLRTIGELKELTKDAANVICVTELANKAGLDPANTSNNAASEGALIDELIVSLHEHGGRCAILSCNLPYDAGRYSDAGAVLLAWSPKGMSENPNYRGDGDLTQYGPAMPAAVYMVFSEDVTPTGKLPVDIPSIDTNYKFTDDILYERGYGLKYGGATKIFRYQHDPRLNHKALEDIIINPDAIYGFSPSPTGSLAAYAEYDWTDAEAVEAYRQNRIEYLQSYSKMYDILDEMTAEGKSIEEIARAVSGKRNELRLAAYDGNPEGLATVKAHNLEKYGHEDGPTADEMFKKYGSWEQVIEKAFSHNPGMDACVGLYDDNYKYYIAFDYIEDERTAAASREYAVAAFIDAVGYFDISDTDLLSAFSDADVVSDIYTTELAQAVKYGILKGYEDGTLRPQTTICRVEALAILDRMLPEKEAVRDAIDFSDVPEWAKASIDNLSAAGIVEGYGDGILGAYDDLTIEQIMLLTERIANQVTATYLGVENYGEPETNKDNKNNFRYRFLIDGKETILSIDNGKENDDGKYDYPIQNILKEGYSYKLKIDGDTVISAKEIIDNAEEFTPVVSGIPGEKTLLNFLKTAMEPVGTTLYIYGGGWDWQDVGSSVEARIIGVSPDWVRFFNTHDENYTYKEKDGDKEKADPKTSYYPYGEYNEYYYAGLDCSGYVGWVLYNTFETENLKDGYVMGSTGTAKKLAARGFGEWTQDITEMKPGEMMSMNGHIWISLGTCSDGSTLILHSTPSKSRTNQPGGGVQISAIGKSADCEAYKLADEYMAKYYPEWYSRYPIYLCDPDVYFTFTGENAGKFTWSADVLEDNENIRNMIPQEVLEILFK